MIENCFNQTAGFVNGIFLLTAEITQRKMVRQWMIYTITIDEKNDKK